MRDLRIVFMGTPEFAVASLKHIIESKYNVVGVITAPDRPAGRGRKLQQSAVKEFAVAYGLPVLQPTNLKSPEFLEELKSLKPNLQVVVAFRMLPKVVWELPEFGTFNLHASLLPMYRGAAPINWAIINGETITGVSTFYIDEKIDTGAMILQKEISIKPNDTVGVLHDKLMDLGANLVLQTLALIKNDKVKTISQKESKGLKEAPKLTKENTRIDWGLDAQKIHDFIRGLNPYPAAWTLIKNGNQDMKTKIYDIGILKESHTKELGEIVLENNKLKVAVKDGHILINEIQLPGKRKMKTKELLNGYQFENGAKVL
ncbi:methionyl-tRNA formyltransferase [Gillisia sp. Hel_I_86]|uniref:methionyl-tRNA formyltransferase n=1 Tax=Gillisia sp. Hel_I_86 TaxID=1249981 RepID=UPI00119C5E76|nr:methionyl-tRNA formyltransferase [Gillisia sp. Hel_I_86]TVZ28550.1 methionyl-tRNA formyltransferase [Gillisia sp. Hel_I_86]